MSTSKSKGPTDYRNSKNGQFVPKDYANKHRSTTEGEHNRKPPSGPKKK
jgi:hypothetical protein